MSMDLFLPRTGGAVALALLLGLGGCASLEPAGVESVQTISARPYLEQVSLDGRLSVRYQDNGREEALHGNFSWLQTPERINLTLFSPLGQTLAVIEVNRLGATLTQAGQSARSASDVDALVADTLGWPLPVAGLRNWLQGFAIDSAGKDFVASPQANEVQTRDGWLIRYASWQEGRPSDTAMPRRIDLQRSTVQAGLVSIRIVIDAWQS